MPHTLSTITPVVGKKRKRNASSDNSDAEVMPAQSPRDDEETSVQVGDFHPKFGPYGPQPLDPKFWPY